MNLRTESIVTGVASVIVATTLIWIAGMVQSLEVSTTTSNRVLEDHLAAAKMSHELIEAELLSHGNRIGTLETRTSTLEFRKDQVRAPDSN